MPPSPATRISPRMELRIENHKRGRSLESGILFREKADDLALFNEVQNKERDNFLLQSNDDFEDIFSMKFRHFSDKKLGISIPARRESSDLLNAEGDKNDYDWLITPPETPLFPSLDDVAPPVSLAPRGRPRSQPITISRSSTMDKGYRSARSSASPRRLSPSPQSVNSTLQSKIRPFPASHSSPPPSLRHSPPSRRLSPSPSKATPAPPRTNTPTRRRMSTGSAGPSAQSRARCPSPVKTIRGNSDSPKIKAWQSNIPGFSLEAPRNLRTSLADRPASYVRGSSPASRNGFRSGKQSMSPTASRSISSSHSHERDQLSSHSKGSVASSGDDDVDSLHSNSISGDRLVRGSVGTFPDNRLMGFPKKANKLLSSSTAKRPFDVALRQMERKGPQNMFRPLLSSAPSSTFYAGKETAHHRPLISRNSSITTSSNTSSDQGTNAGAVDTEEIQQNNEGFEKGPYSTEPDEIFVMDQADLSNEAIESRIIEDSPNFPDEGNDEPFTVISESGDIESDANGTLDTEFCSKCSRYFHTSKLIREGDVWLCLECRSTEINLTTLVPVNSVQILEDSQPLDILEPPSSILGSSRDTSTGQTVKYHPDSIEDLRTALITEEKELNFLTRQEINQSVVDVCSNTTVSVSEGTGISLLLESSSSGKRHIVQSRSFSANNFSYDDFSYARDSLSSRRSSIGQSSASVSASVDLGVGDARSHSQSSGQKSDTENYRLESRVKHRCSVSSLSGGASGLVMSDVTPSCLGDSFEIASIDKDKETGVVTSECKDEESTWTDVESSIMFRASPELSSRSINVCSRDTPVVSSIEEIALNENGDDLKNISSDSIFDESPCGDRVDVAEVPQMSSLNAVSEIETGNADTVSSDSGFDVDSVTSKSCKNESTECYVSSARNDVTTTAIEEFDISMLEESSTVLFEDLGGTNPRRLTLDEATDAILFCSSIVHNMAYEAANIALGKENSPLEFFRPAVTFVGKSNSDSRRDIRSRTRQRKSEPDTKLPSVVVSDTDEKVTQRIVMSPGKGESKNPPPKPESKCNCTIM